MSFEVFHSPQEASQTVRSALALGSCRSSDSRFEILRATIWSMAAPCGKVHINRAINAAFHTWRFLSERADASEETFRAELRDTLSMLEDVGDLIEFSGGYWAPATARFVVIPGTGYLLVGGVPSALLQVDRDVIQFHGPHRYFATFPLELAPAIPLETLESWASLPSNSLQDWAHEIVESLERQPYLPTSADAFDYYLPKASMPGAPQFKRWSDDMGSTTGTLLARRSRLYGAREYRLVEVRRGRIVAICELNHVDVRRLMYAQDLAAKNPVRARPLNAGLHSEWLFMSELPRGEQRAFAAFGTLTIPDDRRFERRWKFTRNEELALDMVRSLGIVIEQQQRKDRR